MIVFVVQHVHPLDVNEEDVKFIGVYSSEANAINGIAELKSLPGFRDCPEGFHIDQYVVDENNWTSGYATIIT